MKTQAVFLAGGLVIGLIVGFLGANYVNRSAVHSNGSSGAPSASAGPAQAGSLSESEIRALIAAADAAPADFGLQAETASKLYSESLRTLNPAVMREAARLLTRVEESRRDDRVLIVFIGNVYFDIGAMAKDEDAVLTARRYYERALALQGGDAEVIADIGMTYTMTTPPDYRKALTYYVQAGAADERNERTLEGFVDAYIALGERSKADEYLGRLKAVNAGNRRLAEFEARLAK